MEHTRTYCVKCYQLGAKLIEKSHIIGDTLFGTCTYCYQPTEQTTKCIDCGNYIALEDTYIIISDPGSNNDARMCEKCFTLVQDEEDV